jgi:arabinosaccharide transport system substrate-binding protein
MPFPLGRSVLALILCSAFTGAMLLFRHSPAKNDMVLWVSADTHARMYRSMLANDPVQVDLIAPAALDVRLLSQFMFAPDGSKRSGSSPDLVEVEIGSIGKYFRPPVDEVGFLPLNRYLDQSGWRQRIVASRFSPWTKDGIVFGIPNDLHPCTLTYRKDLFDAAAVDLSSVKTWEQLQNAGLRYQQYWAQHGQKRWAMGLSATAPDQLLMMLRQQRLQLLDADLSVHLTDDRVVKTLCWYAQAVAGPRQIGMNLSATPGQTARDLATGEIGAIITPDWMIADLKQFAPDLAGKLRMMPLPRFNASDARTASWGGTMIGITRTCPDPDGAWKVIERLYLDPDALKARQATTGILPPIREYWTAPVYHAPEAFYAGQKIDELFIQLADELPGTTMTAYSISVQTYLSIELNRAVGKARSSGAIGLEEDCRHSLAEAQADVQRMIRFDRGED